MVLFDYIFYKIYKLAKLFGASYPEVTSIFVLTMILFNNVLVILILINDSLLNFSITQIKGAKWVPYFIIIMLSLINYYRYGSRKKYSKIIERFCKETEKKRRMGKYLVILYVILSFIATSIFWRGILE